MLEVLNDLLTQLLREEPVVVVIEDAHEMDEQSWNVLLSLVDASDVAALLVVTHESLGGLSSSYPHILTFSSNYSL